MTEPRTSTAAQRRSGGRPQHGEPVVDRALALLAAFQEDRRSMTLAELSRHTGIPASSALRLATRLVAWGALHRDTDGVYTIGARLWQVASLAPGPAGLSETALPHMRDLSSIYRHHVVLASPAADEALMVLRLSSANAVRPLFRSGSRVPLHSTALGRTLLAHMDREVREAVLGRFPAIADPDDPPITERELRRQLAIARRTGFAVVYRAATPELRTMAVATPVRDGRRYVVAALGVILPVDDDEPPSSQLLRSLTAAAERISRDLDLARRA